MPSPDNSSRRPDVRSVPGILEAAELSIITTMGKVPQCGNVPVGIFLNAFREDLEERLADPRFGDLYPSRFLESFLKD